MSELGKWILEHLEDARVVLVLAGVAVDIIYRAASPFPNKHAWLAALPMAFLGAWIMPENRAHGVCFGVIGFAVGLLIGGVLIFYRRRIGERWLGFKEEECPTN